MSNKELKVWFARDPQYLKDENPPVKMFYDTPERVPIPCQPSRWMWGNARYIGEAKPYMYPDIKPGEKLEFSGWKIIDDGAK